MFGRFKKEVEVEKKVKSGGAGTRIQHSHFFSWITHNLENPKTKTSNPKP